MKMTIKKSFKFVIGTVSLVAMAVVLESSCQPGINARFSNSDAVAVGDTTQTDDDDEVYFIVENMPEYPGGDAALRKYVAENTQYPEAAKEKDLHGRVFVQFVINKKGEVVDTQVAKGVDPILDKEAVRVVRSLPNWTPGKQNGVPKNVSYTIPIIF